MRNLQWCHNLGGFIVGLHPLQCAIPPSLHPPVCVPATYWYCKRCASHIHSRGIRCPTKDLVFQHFLLTGMSPPYLCVDFATCVHNLTFSHQLYVWWGERWVAWPPAGLQLLLMEDMHMRLHHVGGAKLAHALACQ